jgi:hypothetical protein
MAKKKPAAKKPPAKKPPAKKPPAKKPPAPKAPPATTDEAFRRGIMDLYKGDKEMQNAITAGIAFGQRLAQDLLDTRLPETLPQALTDLQNEARTRYEESGKIDTYTQAAIDALSKELETAGQISPAQQEALDIAKRSLGGYTSPELQAQREEALSSVLQQAETGTETALRRLGARNIQGGVAGRMAGSVALQAAMARGDLERRLLAENAEVQERRLGAYQGALGAAESRAQGYRANVLGQYADVNVRTGQNLAERRQNAFNAMSDITGRNEAYLADVRGQNAAVQRAALATQYETPLGWGQLYAAARGAKEERDIARIAAERAGQMPMFGGGGVAPGGDGFDESDIPIEEPSAAPGTPPQMPAKGTPQSEYSKEQLAYAIEQANSSYQAQLSQMRKRGGAELSRWLLSPAAKRAVAQLSQLRQQYEQMYGPLPQIKPAVEPKPTAKSLQPTSPGAPSSWRTTL